MVYEWKIPKYRLPAQKAGEELERIERKHGVVTPRNVLEESRPGKAILHDLFEWNDSRAAERFRLEQAQEIIGNIAVVHVVQDAPRTPVRAFMNIIPNDQERGYVSIVRVLTNQEYTRQLLEEALSEFIALRKKYVMLVDLAELFQVIDDFQKKYFH